MNFAIQKATLISERGLYDLNVLHEEQFRTTLPKTILVITIELDLAESAGESPIVGHRAAFRAGVSNFRIVDDPTSYLNSAWGLQVHA